MPGDNLVFEDFKDRVGSVFSMREEGIPAIDLTLKQAELLSARFARPGIRPPFALLFVGPAEPMLPQMLYNMVHGELGAIKLFIVPTGKDANSVFYDCTFN